MAEASLSNVINFLLLATLNRCFISFFWWWSDLHMYCVCTVINGCCGVLYEGDCCSVNKCNYIFWKLMVYNEPVSAFIFRSDVSWGYWCLGTSLLQNESLPASQLFSIPWWSVDVVSMYRAFAVCNKIFTLVVSFCYTWVKWWLFCVTKQSFSLWQSIVIDRGLIRNNSLQKQKGRRLYKNCSI